MACRTASVERVSTKSVKAKDQLEKLTDEIKKQKEKHLGEFNLKVKEHLKNANVNDDREINYNDYIKTEYTSEFSLDKIASVINQSLKTISTVKNAKIPNPAFSDDAIQSYTDMVNTVAEAAKSSSSAAASLTFSMNRLSPGMFAFLSAMSVSLKEEETFGKESVTSTVIFYKVIESIDDLKSETEFNEARIDSENLLNLKTLQAGLTDSLAEGKISIEEWIKKDELYTTMIDKVRARLEKHGFDTDKSAANQLLSTDALDIRQLVTTAISKLAAMGESYKVAIQKSQMRLESAYF